MVDKYIQKNEPSFIIILSNNLRKEAHIYYNPYPDVLKDENLEVTETKELNGILFVSLLLHPKKSYICPLCGSNYIIKNGIRTRNVNINLSTLSKSMVSLKFNRFLCKDCGHIFNDDLSSIVNKKESISRTTRISILFDLKCDLSFSYIANKNNVSVTSVIDIFNRHANDERLSFPEVICVDEFKNLKSAKGKYAFLILDPIDKKIIDCLPDRRLDHLTYYFNNIPVIERNNVKYIISDMFEGYRSIISYYFPNATHIIDAFHYSRYVYDAFNKVRIRIEKNYKDDTPEYKMLKKHWKLLFKYYKDIRLDKPTYNYFLKEYKSISYNIDRCLEIDEELSNAYIFKESFIKSMRVLKYEDAKAFFDKWIIECRDTNIPEFQEIYTMFIHFEKEIINSFIRFGDKRLSNGPIEGMNNRIKNIKRISYGYYNFHNFRKRLMYIINDSIRIK